MSNYWYLCIFLLTSIIAYFLNNTIFSYDNSNDNAIQEYVIHRDIINLLKSADLSIYDKSEEQIHYRMEFSYSLLQNIKLISYPSTEIIGRLEAKVRLFNYKAEFSILESSSNVWIDGLIEQRFTLDGCIFDIHWNDHHISMRKPFFSLTNQFLDSNGERLLAQYRLQPTSIFWKRKYDMQIFSNEYPEQIYLLALTAFDSISSGKKIKW